MIQKLAIISIFLFGTVNYVPRDRDLTPGHLCTMFDPDYSEMVVKSPKCRRNVPYTRRNAVFSMYGIQSQAEYELDHFIPLCLGGSNDVKNLWPQRMTEARRKDKLETHLCLQFSKGLISQKQAIETLQREPW